MLGAGGEVHGASAGFSSVDVRCGIVVSIYIRNERGGETGKDEEGGGKEAEKRE